MNVTFYCTRLNEKGLNVLKEVCTREYAMEDTLNSREKVVSFAFDYLEMDTFAEEYVYLLALTGKNELLGVFEVHHGAADFCCCGTREIFVRALLCGASAILLIHNHPAGDPAPSAEDFKVTERILAAGKIIGIPLLDHIIIGRDGRYETCMKDEDNNGGNGR